MENLRTELTDMLDEAVWAWLAPHAQRDAVVVVHPDLDLIEVGEAIAADNTQSVQRWIGEQLIVKPSTEQIQDWDQNRSKRFNTLIVQPYVLVQEIAVQEAA